MERILGGRPVALSLLCVACVFAIYGTCAWYLALSHRGGGPNTKWGKRMRWEIERLSKRTLKMASVEETTFLLAIVGPVGCLLFLYFSYLIWRAPQFGI